ncbi:MAG TPA: response regulator transcription factor [Peptococcaceae bacterium]|nr:response regulator transcription factor [Peptococcaceae bacterium]
MLKAIAIDDEIAALNQLQKMSAVNGKVQIIGQYIDPKEALEEIKRFRPQIVFLDISMPEFSGLYLAEQIVRLLPQTNIVFITSFHEYALRAFELNAMDYLLKPLTQERFNQCIDKLLRFDSKRIEPDNIIQLNQQFKESAKKIFVNCDEEIILLKPEDIYFFEANDKTVLIRTINRMYTSTSTLEYFESKLQNSNFFRCHRSYLVNLDKVSRFISYSKTNLELGFADIKDTVLVSKRNIGILKKMLEY